MRQVSYQLRQLAYLLMKAPQASTRAVFAASVSGSMTCELVMVFLVHPGITAHILELVAPRVRNLAAIHLPEHFPRPSTVPLGNRCTPFLVSALRQLGEQPAIVGKLFDVREEALVDERRVERHQPNRAFGLRVRLRIASVAESA